MMRTLKILFFLSLFSIYISAQTIPPAIQWQKCLGGSTDEYGSSVIQSPDGGFIIASYTLSNDGDVHGNNGNYDYWIAKLSELGVIQWQKCFGGSITEYANSIQNTSDGGYVIAGWSNSNDSDVTGNHGGWPDYWIVKLDSSRNIQWQRSLGGTQSDYAWAITQTIDGGYIIAGETNSNDGDVSGLHDTTLNSDDMWIVKLDSSGTIRWQKSLGGTGYEVARSIQQTSDSGYIITGSTGSNDGDVSGLHDPANQTMDCWVVKLDSAGSILWQKCLGGTQDESGLSVIQSSDDGFIIAGNSNSNDGDVSGNHGMEDCWIVKLDSGGGIQWQKSLGGTGVDVSHSIQQTQDGGYIVAAISESNDGDVSGNHGGADWWIVKLDSAGNILWQKCIGGSDYEQVNSIIQARDSSYVITGSTYSNDVNVSGNHGTWDTWVVKLHKDPILNIGKPGLHEFSLSPSPAVRFIIINVESKISSDVTYKIYDIQGHLLLEGTDLNSAISVENLSPAMYYIQLNFTEGNKVLRFIKQ